MVIIRYNKIMPNIIITALVFALPFFVGFGTSFFETPKIYAGELLIELLIIYAIFKLKWIKIKLGYFDYILFGIFLVSLSHLAFQPLNNLQFFGNQFRHQGIFLLWHLLAFSFLISKLNIKMNKFVLLSRISIISLLASSFIFGTSVDGRAVGIFGEPNSLGTYAAFIWPLTASIWFAPIAFAIILLSGSRAAFIAFGIQCAFVMLTKKLHITSKTTTIYSLFFILLSLSLPFLDQEATYQNRALIWETAWHAGLSHPFLGWGFGNTEIALKETALKLENNLRYEYVDSAHNILLDWWVQGGIIGILLLIMLIGITLYQLSVVSNQFSDYQIPDAQRQNPKTGIRRSDNRKPITENRFLLSFLALLTCLLFNPVSVAILVPFWWLIGYSTISSIKHNKSTSHNSQAR